MGEFGLFDENGVRRPYDELKNRVDDEPNWEFHYSAPQFFGLSRFAQVLAQFAKHLPAGSKLPDPSDFYGRTMAIIETIRGREDVVGILNGPCLPLVFAAGAIQTDLGTYLESTVLSAVKSAYEGQFEGRPFNSYLQGELARQVSYVPESNLHWLLESMDAGPVVAMYFPDALRAWSILADREQMATLPQDLAFVLPDAIVHGHAIIGYPDVMARDDDVPGQDCAANTWQSLEGSLYFAADSDDLEFDKIDDDLAETNDGCSGGLLLLG